MKCIAEIEGLKNIDVMIMGDKRKFRIVGGRIIKSIYEKMTWLMQIKDLKTGCIYDMDLEEGYPMIRIKRNGKRNLRN